MTEAIETLPPVLRGICSGVLADLSPPEADQFRTDLPAALEVSTADLELVGWRVICRIIERLTAKSGDVLVVLEGIKGLASGGQWSAEEAWGARCDSKHASRTACAAADAATEYALISAPEEDGKTARAAESVVSFAVSDAAQDAWAANAGEEEMDAAILAETRNIREDIIELITGDTGIKELSKLLEREIVRANRRRAELEYALSCLNLAEIQSIAGRKNFRNLINEARSIYKLKAPSDD